MLCIRPSAKIIKAIPSGSWNVKRLLVPLGPTKGAHALFPSSFRLSAWIVDFQAQAPAFVGQAAKVKVVCKGCGSISGTIS